MNIYRLYGQIWKQYIWYLPQDEKRIFLTFDDGPSELITPEILEVLDRYNAKATFFCLGRNVERFPRIYDDILNQGHSTGNHTHNHLNGWFTSRDRYIEDIYQAGKFIQSPLLRPPYGKIRSSQARLLNKNFQIVMWDVMSHDYNRKYSPENIFHHVVRFSRPGSVVVFHDSERAGKDVLSALPKVLGYIWEEGYEFSAIPMSTTSQQTED